MSVIIPIILTINEERFIRQCLTPLANVFPVVIVADTGSTDNNLAEIAKVPNIYQMNSGLLSMEELGQKRGEMAQVAKNKFGASHILIVDGDEIYTTTYARYILNNPMPSDRVAGYTHGIELEELPNGEIWRYGKESDYSRFAVIPCDMGWVREYPFEAPDFSPEQHPEQRYYWPDGPELLFYHMHHLWRSSKDADTRWRVVKQHQFGMVDHPERKPVEFLWKSWKEYVDI